MSKDRQGYANFRGDFATNFCELSLAEGKVKKIDDITIALYGYFDSWMGVDIYPRDSSINLPVLASVLFRKEEYEVNVKDDKGNWTKGKRRPCEIESNFVTEVLSNLDTVWNRPIWGQISFRSKSANNERARDGLAGSDWSFRYVENPSKEIPDLPESTDKPSYTKGNYTPKLTPKERRQQLIEILALEIEGGENTLAAKLAQFKDKYKDDASELLNILTYTVFDK